MALCHGAVKYNTVFRFSCNVCESCTYRLQVALRMQPGHGVGMTKSVKHLCGCTLYLRADGQDATCLFHGQQPAYWQAYLNALLTFGVSGSSVEGPRPSDSASRKDEP